MKQIEKVRYRELIYFTILTFIIFITHWKLLSFDVWQDDNALLFKIQHPYEQVGVFGAGELGLGAYRYVAYPYILLSNIFGINLSIFYLAGLVIHIATAAAVFFLSKVFIKKDELAFLSALLFAISYIGAESLIRLFNSIQTSLSILFILLTFFYFYLYKSKKFILYLICSLLFFFLSIEIGYVRMQYSLIPLLTFWLLYFLNFKKIFVSLITIAPFLGIYIYEYVLNADSRTNLIGTFARQLAMGNFEYLYSFFATIGYLFIPDIFLANIYNFSSTIADGNLIRLYVVEALIILIQLIALYLILWKKNRKYFQATGFSVLAWAVLHKIFFVNLYIGNLQGYQGVNLLAGFIGGIVIIYLVSYIRCLSPLNDLKKFLIFFLMWVFSNVAVYSIYLPFVPLETTSRYLTHSGPPFVLALGLIFYSFGKFLKVSYKYIFLAVILINILLSFFYIQNFYVNKMLPIKHFYLQLKTYVPSIEKNSIIFFEVADDSKSRQQFADFFSVGSMPDTTAIAVRYGLDRYDLQLTQSFNEFKKIVMDKPSVKTYAFYYGDGQLRNKTQDFINFSQKRKIWNVNNEFYIDSDTKVYENGTDIVNKTIKITCLPNVPVFPLELQFKAQARLWEEPDLKFPLAMVDELRARFVCKNYFDSDQLEKSYKAKESMSKISEKIDIKTVSEEKGFEQVNLADNSTDSVWRGGRGHWIENHNEEILIKFDDPVSLSAIEWYNAYADTTPTKYQIEMSPDGINWVITSSMDSSAKKESGWVTEHVGDVSISFIKFSIFDTYEHDSPAISEIRLIEPGIDKNLIGKEVTLLGNGYCFRDSISYMAIRNGNQFKLKDFKVTIITSDGVRDYFFYKSLDLVMGDNFNEYKIMLDLKGLSIKELRFGPSQFPSDMVIKDIEFVSTIGT
ncbi:MAG: hypothetical protein ACD_31C00005G0017 [uncultured bacterium]|uniref:F5/8 type C domain-containing protein n=2 Tax=Candidatus Daviesiibacteriota TaxID=1752718 RepID=A0A1F5ING5_9BACT|nr:MAG: hypothetical protein ACD_31C00005G0017 [uncultured bacterium]KKQ15721.1 MAG: hypothetical protein US28_C0011G0017 [Candidatus Daviesbacteria bacterium GW2011_GWA1_36_8]OGE17860.1 MAG: hypothetical protein A2858_03895 [Candidatus Daviesbacteria bacterium RIFCSPHIGHO2_01_FULL_36_37]